MRLDELALAMARELLAQPRDEMVEVWRTGDDWGWCVMGTGTPPSGAEIVVQDRVQNSDVEPTDDEAAVQSYAAEIVMWLQAEGQAG